MCEKGYSYSLKKNIPISAIIKFVWHYYYITFFSFCKYIWWIFLNYLPGGKKASLYTREPFLLFIYDLSIFLTSTALNKDIFSCKSKSSPCHPERSVSEVELRSSARQSRAGSRARISSFPLVDPDATHRPTGSTAGGARAFLRSGWHEGDTLPPGR